MFYTAVACIFAVYILKIKNGELPDILKTHTHFLQHKKLIVKNCEFY